MFVHSMENIHFVYSLAPGKVESVNIMVNVVNRTMKIIYSKPLFGLTNKRAIYFKCGNDLLYNVTFNNWQFNNSNIFNTAMPCLNEVECSVRYIFCFFLHI